MSKYFRWAELPAREDVYTHAGTTKWGNHDLYPIPKKERKLTWFSYFAYVIICGVNITDYSLGSTYMAVGLTAAEAIGCIFAGSTIAGLISYVTARPGLDHGIGFVSNNLFF
jgi:NCS1 family nucleobase:cation symporter-1